MEDVNRCVWTEDGKHQCPNAVQWQIHSVKSMRPMVCHEHLLAACQYLSAQAPLKVEPIFSNWS